MINAIPLSHATTNAAMKVTATFVYSFYETSDISGGGQQPPEVETP